MMEDVNSLSDQSSTSSEDQSAKTELSDTHSSCNLVRDRCHVGNVLKHTMIPGVGPPSKRARYSSKDLDPYHLEGSYLKGQLSTYGDSSASLGNQQSQNSEFTSRETAHKTQKEADRQESFKSLESETLLPLAPENSTSNTSLVGDSNCTASSSSSHKAFRYGNSESLDDSEDDRMDASNLVLSVIKTKVDIQTMKMCLQHNADAFSNRGAGLAVHLPHSTSSEPAQAAARFESESPEAEVESEAQPRSSWQDSTVNPDMGTCSCRHRSCQTCNSQRQSQVSLDSVCDQGRNHLEHWQDQHTAKAIVDNAINRTIEEMVIAPDLSSPPAACEHRLEHGQNQGAVGRVEQPLQTLQERLEPVINQLTQASELVFARNIEHSRSAASEAGPDSESAFDGRTDHR